MSAITFFSLGWNRQLLQLGDQWGYNSYLVAGIIHGDYKKLNTTYEARNQEYHLAGNPAGSKNRIDEAPDAPNGNRVLKYTYGVALLQTPFFLVTHFIFRGNGYSPPYVSAIYISTLFYVLAGLLILFQILQKYFTPKISFYTIIVLSFFTNLFYFTVCNPGLSHPYLFFLFSCLLWVTIRFYQNPGYLSAAYLGILMGIIVITRPTEICIVLLPLLYGVTDKTRLTERIHFIGKHIPQIITILLSGILVLLPQLLYWKAVSGYWLYDSYPGEGFDFLHPHIPEGLFSFRNGWLSYTPLMIIPLLFLWRFYKNRHALATGTILYLLFAIYINYSWKEWYYNAGLGSRPMVETYALLSFPLACGFAWLKNNVWTKWLIIPFIVFSGYLSLLRTIQMQTGNFISEDANRQFNRQMLFKIHTDLSDLYAFDLNEPQPDTGTIVFSKHIGTQRFERNTGTLKEKNSLGNQYAVYNPLNEYNDVLESAMDPSFHKKDYLKISLAAKVASIENHYRMGKIVVTIQRAGKVLMWKSVRIHNKIPAASGNFSLFGGKPGQWNKLSFYVRIPETLGLTDTLKVYGWNPLGAGFCMDDLSADLYVKNKQE